MTQLAARTCTVRNDGALWSAFVQGVEVRAKVDLCSLAFLLRAHPHTLSRHKTANRHHEDNTGGAQRHAHGQQIRE